MSILPSCDMANHDPGSATPVINQTDALPRCNGRRSNFPHPQHDEFLRPGAPMAMPPLESALSTLNPRVASRALPCQSWRSLGSSFDKAAPLCLVSSAHSPLPWLRNQTVGAVVPLAAPRSHGPRLDSSLSWKRVVLGRAACPGLSRSVDVGRSVRILARGLRVPRRGSESRECSRKSCNKMASPPDALT